MNNYLFPIETALIYFPLLAFLITIPYMILQYRKYGSVNKFRTVVIYSFILYLMIAYFLIILPLPPLNEVINMTTPRVQLMPFQFIIDFLNKTSLVITNPNTYLTALKEPYFYQVLYNLILLFPLGVYMKYYFRCSLSKTILISFLVSLFFELTQLSGLYFIYPRGYRLFDVDDLIINTFGGGLGYLFAPIFTFLFPTREKMDKDSYIKGKKVSFFRRLLAFIIDQFIITFLVAVFNANYSFVYFTYYMLFLSITKGFTLGKKLVKIKITKRDGSNCQWYQYIFRYSIQYLFLVFIPLILKGFNNYFHQINNRWLIYISICINLTYLAYLVIRLCIIIFGNKLFLYEKISKSINSSTILFNENSSE